MIQTSKFFGGNFDGNFLGLPTDIAWLSLEVLLRMSSTSGFISKHLKSRCQSIRSFEDAILKIHIHIFTSLHFASLCHRFSSTSLTDSFKCQI